MTALEIRSHVAWDNALYAAAADLDGDARPGDTGSEAPGALMDDEYWARFEDPLPTKDLAAILRVHEATVHRRLQDGTIPGHHIGRSWIVFKSEIRAWLPTTRNQPIESTVDPDPLAGWPDELRMAELMEFFGKTKQTIRRWLEHGDLPGYRLSGRWIVYKSELRDALARTSNQHHPE